MVSSFQEIRISDGRSSGQVPPASAVVRPAADLGVVQVGVPVPAPTGGAETDHIRVTNHGPSRATGIQLTDGLPDGVHAAHVLRDCKATGREIVRCRIRSLAVGASVTRFLRTRISRRAAGRRLVNRATVRGALADRVTSNSTDRAVATAGPRLVLRNTAARTSVSAGTRDRLHARATQRQTRHGAANRAVRHPRHGPTHRARTPREARARPRVLDVRHTRRRQELALPRHRARHGARDAPRPQSGLRPRGEPRLVIGGRNCWARCETRSHVVARAVAVDVRRPADVQPGSARL